MENLISVLKEFISTLNLSHTVYLVFGFLVFSYVYKRKRHYAPGPWGIPVVGHLPLFGQRPTDTFKIWRNKYGDVFRIRLGSWNAIVLNGHDTVKCALERQDSVFSNRPDFISTQITRCYRDGEESVVFGPFDAAYQKQRKLAMFALRQFTNVRESHLHNIIRTDAEKLISHFMSRKETPNFEEEAITFSVASMIYRILFGKGENMEQDNNLQEMVHVQEGFVEFVGPGNAVDVLPWLRFVVPRKLREFMKFIHFSDALVHRKVCEHKESFISSNLRDVTDVFIAAQLPDSVQDKTVDVTEKRQMLTLNDLLGAGFGTLSRTMHWLILYMVAYPEVQKKVQSEIDLKVGHGRTVDFNDRPHLDFLQATIIEVMRINPVVPVSIPHVSSAATLINGYFVDKGTVIIANLKSVNHDETIWENPELFKPERHLDCDGYLKKRNYLPITTFGFGRRKCIGENYAKLQLFLLFAMLMQRCTFHRPEDNTIDLEPVEKLLASPKPYRVIVKERK